jgi:hypothetical protein
MILFNTPLPDPRLFPHLRAIRLSQAPVLIPGAVSDDFIDLCSGTVPQNETGFLVGYGIQVQDPSYDYGGSLLFRVTVASSPIDNGAPFAEQRGDLITQAPAHYPVQASDLVRIQARRAIAYAYAQRVAAVAIIYSWPLERGTRSAPEPQRCPQPGEY